MRANNKAQANQLIHETSPYLLQHAYNPVNWLPFGDEAFEIAKRENKPVLVSIGYSACHWCHVMEHESFEDAAVAEVMNRAFINVKVDREERSDVDMLYMQAIHLMRGQGGWPLNCFVMPDGKPFYGGTYFPKEQWLQILHSLSDLYQNDIEKVKSYAEQLTEGIRQSELIVTADKNKNVIDRQVLKQTVAKWKGRLDNVQGGPDKAPKFPLPSNYKFLLRYALLEKDDALRDHVNLTLRKMAFGGIYDQVHGGFARYSVDSLWKVPHFEKMLYDNSQLASLYCEAYNATKDELYKEITVDILAFVEKEWYNNEGYFYSAFDADSEGVEGKYYVWSQDELQDLLADDYLLFSRYFQVNETGYWEHGNYILMRNPDLLGIIAEFNISKTDLKNKINDCREILRKAAASRVKPGLDDKTVTAWNALMCSAFAQAYLSFGNTHYKDIAISSARFILNTLSDKNGKLFRTYKNGVSKIDAFLDDYAFVVEAMVQCYLVTQDEFFLDKAKTFTEYALIHFDNPASVYLFYTPDTASNLVARTTEVSDNVVPASNSQMALNLFYLGHYFENQAWVHRAGQMLSSLAEEMQHYGGAYSNWGILALHLSYPFFEIAIVGKNVDENMKGMFQHGLTNAIFAVNVGKSELPLLHNRYVENKNMIYVCREKTCKKPVETINEALSQID